jgi:membrane protein YdbS with pleckstrin-like domain
VNFAVDFPGKEPGEKILLVLRRHWYVVFRRIVAFAFAAFAPGVALLVATQLGHPFVFDPRNLSSVLGVLAVSLFELFIWVFFYVAWLDYELDVFIITDQRIVNIAQNGLFARTVSEQRLFRVQDVTSEVRGILPTFLRFGTVYVQTAGEKGHFIFRNVPDPENVAKVILGEMDRIEATMGMEMRAEMAATASGGKPAAKEKTGPAKPA